MPFSHELYYLHSIQMLLRLIVFPVWIICVHGKHKCMLGLLISMMFDAHKKLVQVVRSLQRRLNNNRLYGIWTVCMQKETWKTWNLKKVNCMSIKRRTPLYWKKYTNFIENLFIANNCKQDIPVDLTSPENIKRSSLKLTVATFFCMPL